MTTDLPDNLLVVDDDGMPKAFVSVDTIQNQATRFAFDLAEVCHDPAALDAVNARHLAEAGVDAFGYVAAAALRIVVHHVLEPTLQVTDALHDHGRGPLHHNLRAGLADAAANARGALATDDA